MPAMTKVSKGIPNCIFAQINMINTILITTDHLPSAVLGRKMFFTGHTSLEDNALTIL